MSTPNNHQISKAGLDFIKGFESFVPYVYDDKRKPVHGQYPEWDGGPVWGTLTCGYGHTNAARDPLKIKQGLRLTEAEACQVLDVDLDECEEAVNSLVKVPLTQGMFDALASFTFNCGTGNLKRLIVPLNLGNYTVTRANFDHYIRSKGEVMRGLQRRRDGEQVLWDSGDVSLPAEIVEHPAEVDAKPTSNIIATTVGSRSVRAGGFGLAAIYGILQGWWNELIHYAIPPADGIQGLIDQTQSSVDTTKQLAGLANINIEHLMLWVVLAVLGYMMIRRVLDKREQQQ